jgi:hypothetical protein
MSWYQDFFFSISTQCLNLRIEQYQDTQHLSIYNLLQQTFHKQLETPSLTLDTCERAYLFCKHIFTELDLQVGQRPQGPP